MKLSPEEQKQQELYRDARLKGSYDKIWQTVGECAFCQPRDKYILYEENDVILTVNLFAYIDGHLLIIPRRHIRSAKDLTAPEWETMRKLMYMAKKMIRQVHRIKGVQYILRDGGITAQSTVSDHLHMNCVPFDAPDLSVWNYRKLKYTPLESMDLYKKHGKIDTLAKRYNQKYRTDT